MSRRARASPGAGRRSRRVAETSCGAPGEQDRPEQPACARVGSANVRVAALALRPLHVARAPASASSIIDVSHSPACVPQRASCSLIGGYVEAQCGTSRAGRPSARWPARTSRARSSSTRRVAAVAVEEHEPAEARRARRSSPSSWMTRAERLLRERHRAGERRVLVAAAVGQRRQHPAAAPRVAARSIASVEQSTRRGSGRSRSAGAARAARSPRPRRARPRPAPCRAPRPRSLVRYGR